MVTSAGLILPLDIMAATAWQALACFVPPIRAVVIAVTFIPLQKKILFLQCNQRSEITQIASSSQQIGSRIVYRED